MIARAQANFSELGWGRWALEERESGLLIGHCGFMPVPPEVAISPGVETFPGVETSPGVEIGWRLSERWQGRGLAREAAEASLQHGFNVLGFDRVFSYTTPPNTASWGLMERLGMTFVREFDHPSLPDGHALKRHLLYELRKDHYRG